MFDPSGLAQRIEAVAHGAIGALPQTLRKRAEAQLGNGSLPQFTEAMTAWSRGTRLDEASFAERFFGRAADDPVSDKLHRIVRSTIFASSYAELRDPMEKLAEVMQTVGLDRWPRFLADAQERARDPATIAAVEKSRQPPDPRRDAIYPSYLPETLIGIGAAGFAGGLAAAARAAGAAIAKRALTDSASPTDNTVANAAPQKLASKQATNKPELAGSKTRPETSDPLLASEKPPISRQKQDSHVRDTPQNRNRLKNGKPTSTFDGNRAEAEALTREAWQKGKHVLGQSDIRDYNFGRRIGEGPSGGGQSIVRVHRDASGRIHGHPVGPETP